MMGVWRLGRRWRGCALIIGGQRFGPAFLKARFKIERVCNLILYVALRMGLIAALFLEIYVVFQHFLDLSVQRGKFARQRLQIGMR